MAKLNDDFRPAPQLRTLYYIYILSFAVMISLIAGAPIAVFAPPIVTLFLGIPFLAIVIVIAAWITMYYPTISYKFTGDDITWRRGIWFRQTGIVPYNRITNVDISQGPVSRKFGIASLKIQTAGYSAPNARSSEIRIDGVEKFEEMRETIMDFVRGRKPMAVETYEPETSGAKPSDDKVLKELVKIRKLLEKK